MYLAEQRGDTCPNEKEDAKSVHASEETVKMFEKWEVERGRVKRWG
jgi:hypothetical protein